jgi:hypothetical protein
MKCICGETEFIYHADKDCYQCKTCGAKIIRCVVTGCEEEGIERHHVTYNDPVIRVLCSKHHLQITAINSHTARKQHHALSDKQRWFLWFKFKEGLIKTRITHLDRQWNNYGE